MSALRITAIVTLSSAILLSALSPVVALAARLPASKAVTTDTVQQIREGMTREQVLALIGPPIATTRFNATRTTAWDYRDRDLWTGDAELSVILNDAGIVVGKAERNDQ